MQIQHETIIYKAIHGQTYNLNCLTICIQLSGRRLNLTDKDQLVDTERTRMLNVYATYFFCGMFENDVPFCGKLKH